MRTPIKINSVPFYQAIKAAQDRGIVLPDVYYGELQGLARQLSFSIAGIAAYDQLEQVRNSLSAGLQRGVSFNKWKKEILENGVLDLPAHRLDNIFRTNIQNNYNRGRWERFQKTKSTRPYLMYDAINDSRVRPNHLAMDGIIRKHGHKFWDEHAPSNGYRCRCRLISLSEKQAQRRSGQGQGLNKRINSKTMSTDDGWGYNPGNDLTIGLRKAINKKPVTVKKVLKEKAADNQFWKAGTSQAHWHNASFLESALFIKNAIKKYDKEFIRITSTGRGAYQSGGTINMPGSYDIKNLSDRATWRHEYGHFLDYKLGLDGAESGYISSQGDFTVIMKKETDHLLSIIGKGRKSKKQGLILAERVGARQRIINNLESLPTKDKQKFINDKLKALDLDRDSFDDFIRDETLILDLTKDEAAVKQGLILQSIEDRDALMFMNTIYDNLSFAEKQKAYKKGQTGKFSDLVGSASKNKLLGHGDGGVGGHSNSYLKQPGSQQTEVFANLTTLLGNGKFWIKMSTTFYPELSKKYNSILTEAVNENIDQKV